MLAAPTRRVGRVAVRRLRTSAVHLTPRRARTGVTVGSGGGSGKWPGLYGHINTIVPPLAVRAGLVGAATALMTPAFPVIGFTQLVFRFLDPVTRMALSGGGSFLLFSAMVLLPKSFYYAPILLPLAIGNAITASGLYLLLDLGVGGPAALAAARVLAIPVAGIGIGLGTALLAPFSYPLAFAVAFPEMEGFRAGDPELYAWIREVVFSWWLFPAVAGTGTCAGGLLHGFLRPLLVGVPGVPWPRLAGGVLAASGVALGVLYSTSLRIDVPHAAEAELDPPQAGVLWGEYPGRYPPSFVKGEQELCWLPGLSHDTAEPVSWLWCLPEVQGATEAKQTVVEAAVPVSFVPGPDKALDALDLRTKVNDKGGRMRCYTSRRGAYFDGLGFKPIADARLADADALPLGEAILTDAVVLLVAGKVAPAAVESGLSELLPLLADSQLAARLQRRVAFNPLQRSWADDASKVHVVAVAGNRSAKAEPNQAALRKALGHLLHDLALRGAQLRELWRLRNGAEPGPLREALLQRSLATAGIDIERAVESLVRLGWSGPRGGLEGDASERAADWRVIGGHQQNVAAQTMGGVVLAGIASVACCAVTAVVAANQ